MHLLLVKKYAAKAKGFTMIEILISLLLISIFTLLSFPAWQHLIHKNRIEITTQSIVQLLKASRQFAMLKKQEVLVCLSSDRFHCQISQPCNYVIARSGAKIVAEVPIDSRSTSITWVSNLAKNAGLVFMPTGMTNGQQGHFRVMNATTLQQAEVVVLMSGSVYVRAMNLSMAESK